MSHLRHTSDKKCNVKASPNTYEDPRCQETDSPSERIVPIFSAGVQAERRPPLTTCSVFISVGWCTHVTAPNTY
jgi:hypothetical protein